MGPNDYRDGIIGLFIGLPFIGWYLWSLWRGKRS